MATLTIAAPPSADLCACGHGIAYHAGIDCGFIDYTTLALCPCEQFTAATSPAKPADNPQPSNPSPQPSSVRAALIAAIDEHITKRHCADSFYAGKDRLDRISEMFTEVGEPTAKLLRHAFFCTPTTRGSGRFSQDIGDAFRLVVAEGATLDAVNALIRDVRDAEAILQRRIQAVKQPAPPAVHAEPIGSRWD